MPKSKIALVAHEQEDVDAYLKHLSAFDVEIVVVASFRQLEKLLATASYNGIIVDLKTKLALAREQKMLAYDLLEHYPVLQSRLIPGTDRMQTLPFGKVQQDVQLESFLLDECPNFEARKIRSSIRRRQHFNVLLSKSGRFTDDDLERTTTLNMSRNGCYLITSGQWAEHTNVPIIFRELTVQSPIVGEIRWRIPWGRSMKVPGIGIRFEDIQASQQQELVEKYNLE